jgi:hypothetical protein
VVLLGLLERQQPADRPRVHPPAARVGAELLHARIAAPVAVVDVEEAVPGEVRVEGHAEETLLGSRLHSSGQVQGDGSAAALPAKDPAGLLGDPPASCIAGRDARPRRAVQSVRESANVERVRPSLLRGRRRRLLAGGLRGRRG